MKKVIKKYKDLPFEIEKIYVTKFQTSEKVILKRIDFNKKGEVIGLGVIYENSPHLGICPLGADRLITDKIEDGEICVCHKCGSHF